MPKLRTAVIYAFWQKVRIGQNCWEWTAATYTGKNGGYGAAWDGYKRLQAHRLSWRINVGPIPAGKCVLHHCDNRLCVRPEHLYVGTKKDNATDRKIRRRHWRDRNHEAFISHMRKISSHPGQSHYYAKLTDRAVRDIRSSRSTCRELAEKYGVDKTHVWRVRTGKSWAHVI